MLIKYDNIPRHLNRAARATSDTRPTQPSVASGSPAPVLTRTERRLVYRQLERLGRWLKR
jgi:hypothetical protein